MRTNNKRLGKQEKKTVRNLQSVTSLRRVPVFLDVHASGAGTSVIMCIQAADVKSDKYVQVKVMVIKVFTSINCTDVMID